MRSWCRGAGMLDNWPGVVRWKGWRSIWQVPVRFCVFYARRFSSWLAGYLVEGAVLPSAVPLRTPLLFLFLLFIYFLCLSLRPCALAPGCYTGKVRWANWSGGEGGGRSFLLYLLLRSLLLTFLFFFLIFRRSGRWGPALARLRCKALFHVPGVTLWGWDEGRRSPWMDRLTRGDPARERAPMIHSTYRYPEFTNRRTDDRAGFPG